MNVRVGLGYDVHPFGGSGPLVLGGVTIVHEPGLAGHSDADVVAHAVADALLGGSGLPDLGTRFPASDPRYRNASSIALLREVAAAVRDAGWRVGNVDIVVAAEEPRLAPHVGAMVDTVTAALAVCSDSEGLLVAVKPKRGEGLGAIGRAEGIAAWAVALLVRM